MYELKHGSNRLISALYNRKDDPSTVRQLATALNYMPEQLQQDIQALYDRHNGEPDFQEYATKSETELNAIFDFGLFNEICKGYATLAMEAAGIDRRTIAKTIAEMSQQFDSCTAEDARAAR